MSVNPGPLLTKHDVAALLRCSIRTIENLVKEGQIPAPIHIGRRPYWHADLIQKWLGQRFGLVVASTESGEAANVPGAVASASPAIANPVVFSQSPPSAAHAIQRARARNARKLNEMAAKAIR
ncbi:MULTISPECIES: helix-turn-helix transcriptional regulator [Burkholderia]|uniref:helix-turn-helix transcriptional regulator n=1 Tax=Burkholderia TaxID=32008 RepID=UPI0015E072AC|nr:MULTISPECIES: helix-turn-helix domain-containing protein [unclassified Burkholderia]